MKYLKNLLPCNIPYVRVLNKRNRFFNIDKTANGTPHSQPPQVLLTKNLEYFLSNTCTYNTLKFRIFSYLIDEGKRVTEFFTFDMLPLLCQSKLVLGLK